MDPAASLKASDKMHAILADSYVTPRSASALEICSSLLRFATRLYWKSH